MSKFSVLIPTINPLLCWLLVRLKWMDWKQQKYRIEKTGPAPSSCVCNLKGLPDKETSMTSKQNPRDQQAPHTGKVENDTNKLGEQEPTQLNQGKRTPDSRSDREAHVGGSNQSQSRRGPVGTPKR
jgi:hypothetical protein